MFTLTFKGGIRECGCKFPVTSRHSFKHLAIEIFHTFDKYDYKYVFKKIMQLRKAPDESLDDFHDHFIHFFFEIFEDDVYWPLMKEKFEFIVHISTNT